MPKRQPSKRKTQHDKFVELARDSGASGSEDAFVSKLRKIAKLSEWIADTGQRRFVIRHDPAAGFYLLVYDKGACTRDYLQDTLEQALAQATEEFGVARDSWRPAV